MFVSVKLKVALDNSGNTIDIPGLLTPKGPFSPLVDYFLARYIARSLSWMDKVERSVRLFLEYMHANPCEDGRTLFENFAKRLYSGTVDGTTGVDDSQLYWKPRRATEAASIITNLTHFFDWIGANSPLAAELNPLVPANSVEARWSEAAQRYRRERRLLGHLWSPADASSHETRRVRPKPPPPTRRADPPAFPEDRFEELIKSGFRVGNRQDHRGICITLLLHGAGVRPCEPFHLFVEDVISDPRDASMALVRIHHPSDGQSPKVGLTRAAYLMERFGLKPRDKLTTESNAGWKGVRCDEPYYMEVRWFEPEYGRLFLHHWKLYLQKLVQVERNHPFAFANLGREPRGEMYKLGQFNDAHARACRRIGLAVAKELGTTPHGHRHAYGQRLKNAGISPYFIQICMHHISVESQEVYTQPTGAEIAAALKAGAQRLAESSRS
ncbi:gamma-mobile-trio recombinase GmtY [Mitsuaria sp. CC2]|uniref:gamma-mobile-trio recombinase GmtY n=1 Tax=Mitsuaria sp. CC2 TaxID=3029186 RepID=UPI003B8AB3F5